ncbi:MAG: hypothetical protein AVDCRST_MAG10-2622, partial [uncultured Acidimicrobiales bacterium]
DRSVGAGPLRSAPRRGGRPGLPVAERAWEDEHGAGLQRLPPGLRSHRPGGGGLGRSVGDPGVPGRVRLDRPLPGAGQPPALVPGVPLPLDTHGRRSPRGARSGAGHHRRAAL